MRVLRSTDGPLRSQPVGPTPQKLAAELRDGVVPVLQKQVANLCPFVVGEVQPVANGPRKVDAVRTHVGGLGDRTVAPQLLAPLGCRRCSDPQCVIDLRARRPVGPGPLEHPFAHLRPQRFSEQVEPGTLGRVHRQESFGDAIDHHAGLVDPCRDVPQREARGQDGVLNGSGRAISTGEKLERFRGDVVHVPRSGGGEQREVAALECLGSVDLAEQDRHSFVGILGDIKARVDPHRLLGLARAHNRIDRRGLDGACQPASTLTGLLHPLQAGLCATGDLWARRRFFHPGLDRPTTLGEHGRDPVQREICGASAHAESGDSAERPVILGLPAE